MNQILDSSHKHLDNLDKKRKFNLSIGECMTPRQSGSFSSENSQSKYLGSLTRHLNNYSVSNY